MKLYWKLGAILFIAFLFTKNEAFAAISCPSGGGVLNVPAATTVIVNGPCNYTDVTVSGTISSDVGEKVDMTLSGTLTINAGGGIDVTGKGNNPAGQGGNGASNGSACTGVYAGGGGGGGYGGVGIVGASDVTATGGSGGSAYGSSTAPTDLGSSGGLGGGNVSGSGIGGGAVKISAPNIIVNGYIRANGTAGSDPRGNDGSGAGGGGSGGSIWLVVNNSFDFTGGSLEAKGGDGGADVNCGGSDGAGGAGGGGRISLQYKGPKIGSGTHSETGGTFYSAGAVGTFYEDPCYGVSCGNYCGGTDGLTAYFGGTCNMSTGVCGFATVTNCTDADTCTFDACDAGVCSNSPVCGGLVPCGRTGDNPNTTYNEASPCTLCHIFIMLQMIVTFVVEIGGIIAVFFLVIGGLIYATSAGNQGRMETGKKAIMWALFGLAIILLSWLIVTVVLTAFGYINPLGGQWNIVSCTVP